ncbi:MAG: hypothetical protein D6727_05445 [Gammaproteobacteria bacterium]|nr:MAG: hypothetical protein D6727_05445 [Gammaproteobacteria bacterium]
MHSRATGVLTAVLLSFFLPPVGNAQVVDPDADWAQRSAAPGVVYRNRFDDYQTDFWDNLWPDPAVDRREAYYDTNVRASGNASLRFDFTGNSGEGFGGELAVSLGDNPADQFGAGDDMWVQWRQRWDQYVIDHQYAVSSGSGQWKQLIISQGQLPGQSRWDTRSCSENQIVVSNLSGRKYPQSYHGCWVYYNIDSATASGAITRMNFGDPSGNPNPPSREQTWPCQYWPPGSDTSGCKFYRANQWMTFMVHVKFGPAGEAQSSIGSGIQKGFINSTYELYVGYEGEPLELVHRVTGIVFRRGNYADDPLFSSHQAKFGMFRWLPLISFKSSEPGIPTHSTWIDELIISRQQIPAPNAGPLPSLPVVNLSASAAEVAQGGSVSLNWSASDATACAASGGWSGAKALSGSEVVGPLSGDTSFLLSCSNANGSTQRTVSVSVVGPPVVNLAASPQSVVPGGSTVLAWSSSAASSCTATGGWSGPRSPNGSEPVGPIDADTVFGLSCSGAGGSSSASVTVTADASPGQEVILLFDDFDAYAAGAQPAGWLDTGAGNSLAPDPDRFRVVDLNGNKVFATTDTTTTNIHSHYTAAGSFGWNNYEYSGRLRTTAATDSIGVTILSDYPNSDSYYRLRSWNGNPFEINTHGSGLECIGDPDTGVVPVPGQWYWFRLQAEDSGGQTLLRARLWPEGQAEPAVWQASCADSGTRRSTGTVGLWAVVQGDDAGPKYWDNLDVRTLAASGPAPALSFSADATQLAPGGSVTLSWIGSNVDSCSAADGWSGGKPTTGSETLGPLSSSATFSLTCSSSGGGVVTRSVSVLVQSAPSPVLDLSAAPPAVAYNGSSTLSWTSSDADRCTAAGGWSGDKPVNGSQRLDGLTQTATYTLSCTGAGGQAQRSVVVEVAAPPPGSPAAPTLEFSASATVVTEGDSTVLSWSAGGATSCTASGGWTGARAPAGSQTVGPLTQGNSYTLSCSGDGGTVSRSLSIVVEPPQPAAPPAAVEAREGGGGGGAVGWATVLILLPALRRRRRR